MLKWLLLSVLALSTVACGGSSEQIVETRGVVQSVPDLEGGWWYIETATGEKYTPCYVDGFETTCPATSCFFLDTCEPCTQWGCKSCCDEPATCPELCSDPDA